MGRKPRQPPPILRLEGLSTGIDPSLVDDFTGEVVPQPHARPPVMDNAQDYRDAQNRVKAEHAKALCEASGITAAAQRSAPKADSPTLGHRPVTGASGITSVTSVTAARTLSGHTQDVTGARTIAMTDVTGAGTVPSPSGAGMKADMAEPKAITIRRI